MVLLEVQNEESQLSFSRAFISSKALLFGQYYVTVKENNEQHSCFGFHSPDGVSRKVWGWSQIHHFRQQPHGVLQAFSILILR